ncbi:MAG: YeeE/YedE thiosulfate transporter family protein [Acidobacteriota bacterium]
MTFPFEILSSSSREAGLVVAVLIGIAFGFVLERAGFGRADKLAAQFYLRDMRVFKVMFTGIVTAMTGLVIASAFGLVNLREISESIASPTWIWPMLAGGFVLGAGFIISGYCPGTSIVATASGNLDGLVTVAGVVTGTFLYSELLQIPVFHQFHNSGAKGAWFLYDIVKGPPQLVAAVIAAGAVLAFVGAEKVEAWLGGERTAKKTRRFALATVMLLAVTALVTIAVPATPAQASVPTPAITAAELARVFVDAPWSVRVLDTRDAASFGRMRVPGSQNVTAASLADVPDDGRTIVVVLPNEAAQGKGGAMNLPAHARVLAGGIAAWHADPLVVAMTSGAPPPPPPPAAGGAIAKPRKKGGGCSS